MHREPKGSKKMRRISVEAVARRRRPKDWGGDGPSPQKTSVKGGQTRSNQFWDILRRSQPGSRGRSPHRASELRILTSEFWLLTPPSRSRSVRLSHSPSNQFRSGAARRSGWGRAVPAPICNRGQCADAPILRPGTNFRSCQLGCKRAKWGECQRLPKSCEPRAKPKN